MSYVFKCVNCDEIFLVEMSIKDYEKAIGDLFCPYCASGNVRRDYTPITVHYKGKGFYTTDKDD